MMLEVTPKKDNLPRSFYDEKRLVSKLGLEVRKTGYCISGCMLFMIMSLVLMIKRSRNVISGIPYLTYHTYTFPIHVSWGISHLTTHIPAREEDHKGEDEDDHEGDHDGHDEDDHQGQDRVAHSNTPKHDIPISPLLSLPSTSENPIFRLRGSLRRHPNNRPPHSPLTSEPPPFPPPHSSSQQSQPCRYSQNLQQQATKFGDSICYNTDEWELINKYAKRFVKTGVKLRQTSFETWMGFAAKRDEPCKLMFAMELAEMLSTDMQKEGLHGRTLTLKLKTTSFEVRNRAVTLQNYINSSEDILKHASKLLKAELPVSVRLIGLRVSQFNGDKSGSGATPDRTQKTITNFITSGEANRKKDPFSDVTDHDFISDIETDPSIDVGHTSQLDSRDPFDGNHSLDVNHQSCTLWKNDGAEKVQTSGNDAASSHHSACTEMLGSTSFQGKFEGKNVIGLCFFSQDQKHRINRQSKSKKQKLSQREGRYTPIDYFFVKE
ncbi:hypothetical protein KIW84_021668 [Lathyrus oleraceus]|uniref:DNA-directed DNA polymerase n=2 Tax=Pisum sativum TaxID=3888 RepID=A0A9D4YAH7_PEA|nr:hypothetical protein KIW84_021668 [Pisum sativum]